MPYKVSFIFKADDAGFTENWYTNDATDPTGAIARTVMGRAVVVAQARNALIGAYCYLDKVRVSDLNYLGDSLVTSRVSGPPAGNGVAATFELPPLNPQLNNTLITLADGTEQYLYERDTSWNSIDCQAQSTNLYRRPVFLRGVPDLWIAYDQYDNPVFSDAVFNGNFQNFVKVLVGNQFCIQSVSKVPATNPKVAIPVGGLTKGAEYPVGSGQFMWEIAVPPLNMAGGAVPALTNGMAISIGGVRGVNVMGVRGTQKIFNCVGTPVTSFQIFVPYPLNPPTPYFSTGGTAYWKTRTLTYPLIDSLIVSKYGSRKVGKRIGKQPGRLPAKKKW
jgi:hypothetical protein